MVTVLSRLDVDKRSVRALEYELFAPGPLNGEHYGLRRLLCTFLLKTLGGP